MPRRHRWDAAATGTPCIKHPEDLEALPGTTGPANEEVALQSRMGTPYRLLGAASGDSFRWDAAEKDAVERSVKDDVRHILQEFAEAHGISLTGDSAVKLALHRGNFWITWAGGPKDRAPKTRRRLLG